MQNWHVLNVFMPATVTDVSKKEHYHFVADALVRRGYVVVIPDYIKYPDGRFPTFVEDIALATAWGCSMISLSMKWR